MFLSLCVLIISKEDGVRVIIMAHLKNKYSFPMGAILIKSCSKLFVYVQKNVELFMGISYNIITSVKDKVKLPS